MSDDDAREGWTLDQILARTVALRLLQRELRGQEAVEEETRTLRRMTERRRV